MDTSKIKNILIIILLFLNASLLGLMLADNAEARRDREETTVEIRRVLQDSGITADENLDFFQESPDVCTVVRDAEAEMEKVAVLLGRELAVEDLGGNIYFYSSEKGQANLRGTGELDFIFYGEAVNLRGRPEKAAEKLADKAGIATAPRYTAVTKDGDNSRVELCCAWEEYPIYNAKLGFDVYGESLLMVSGVRHFDTLTSRTDEGVMDCVSVVMRFVEIVKNDGFICRRLENIEAGYIMSVAVSGESTLVPVWRIDADTGTLYINALTGKTETI